jgi:signal transduction histidine kinase
LEVEGDIYVRGDQAQLNQVLINLIANSIKFSSEGSTIEIAISQVEKSAVILIKDYGIGISDVDLPHIFGRFYRGSNADGTQYQGTGLGLAIVEQVIQHHHGTVEVSSQLGEGSTFIITLPLFSEGGEVA